MGRQIHDLTFEEWMIFTFDHPVEEQKQEWYWDIYRDEWDENSPDVIRFLTQAFEHAAEVFQPYSDAQVNQALWYIASNSCSNHMFALMDEAVAWRERERCIYSIHQLYEQCFLPRCSPHLSHLDEPGANPLNSVCYMWWGIAPLSPHPEEQNRREFDRAILNVMESTLQLDSVACRESALHGLGHWQRGYPERVGGIINKFSMEHRSLRKELETYMGNAFTGYVL